MDEEKCPVDHKARQQWLNAAKKQPNPPPSPHPQHIPIPTTTKWSLDNGHWETPAPKRPKLYTLSKDREISTIPRAISTAVSSHSPANSERDTGHDRESGNWIYPSQEQFFEAIKRKGHTANPTEMQSVVPIHNAVNERAWTEIKQWEKGWGGERCGGPKLVSFAGDSKAMTPRARWNGLLGYEEPFDRHDWVVDRCGKEVEYVIDFYKGKSVGGKTPLSFYLDVRPKLNSWEGVKMRVAKTLGF